MFIKEKLKYFTRPQQILPDLSGVSGDFRIVCDTELEYYARPERSACGI